MTDYRDQPDLRTLAQRRIDWATYPFRRALSWLRWCMQGRPTDEPVVIQRGRLIQRSDGRKLITGWFWDTSRQVTPISELDLWVRYSVRYGVEADDD